ncbi:MAG: AAA family ATPase [Devosia sp.]
MMKNWKMTSGPGLEPDDDDDEALQRLMRSDFALEANDRAILGKPRLLALRDYDRPFIRITHAVSDDEQIARRGGDERRDRHAVRRLIQGLGEIKTLAGPGTSEDVDEFVAKVFAEAPNFGPALEALRQSAQVHIRGGARWLQFRPLVIESSPGAGKTRLAKLLAETSGLQMVYLDCAAMTNMSPIISQDGTWGNSRQSDIMQALASSASANVIVVLDELDKLRDFSRHGSPKPSEALVGLLERHSAASHMDNFLQLAVDLSFINWIILVNDMTRLSQPFLDRCKVIQLAPPTATEIATIAAREIERRGLEPELVAAITKAVQSGKITSLRTLHKLLDAAAAASARSILH